MTKICVESWGWLYLVVVLDWASKKIVGWDLATTSKAADWLRALCGAVDQQFQEGIREHAPPELVSDNGCQPTWASFMVACHALEIRQIFISYSNPKGNADTERCLRALKEDLIWPNERFSFQQLHAALGRRVDSNNTNFPHSAPDYRTPQQYEDQRAAKPQPIAAAH